MVDLVRKTEHLNRPFENLNFQKFDIQMVGIQIPGVVHILDEPLASQHYNRRILEDR